MKKLVVLGLTDKDLGKLLPHLAFMNCDFMVEHTTVAEHIPEPVPVVNVPKMEPLPLAPPARGPYRKKAPKSNTHKTPQRNQYQPGAYAGNTLHERIVEVLMLNGGSAPRDMLKKMAVDNGYAETSVNPAISQRRDVFSVDYSTGIISLVKKEPDVNGQNTSAATRTDQA